MDVIGDTLKKRMEVLTTPTPTISIFRGKRWLASDTGAQGQREEVFVQLDVKFRDAQLAQLKGATLSVFLSIALHIGEQGISYPSMTLISKESGFNKDTVLKAIGVLEKMGYISRIQPKDEETGKFTSNRYRVFPKSWEAK